MKLSPVTAPAALMTAADVKPHLSLATAVDFDAQLEGYIAAAVSLLDGPRGVLGRCMVTQVWAGRRASWTRQMPLGLPDVSAVVVTYSDAAGDVQTLDDGLFEIVAQAGGDALIFRPGMMFPDLDPNSFEPITLTITAGYGAPEDVPAALLQAVRMLVAHMFEKRGTVASEAEMPMGPRALMAPFRMTGI